VIGVEGLLVLAVIVAALVVLDVAALAFGSDSRESFDQRQAIVR
jgi:hypothetical protein